MVDHANVILSLRPRVAGPTESGADIGQVDVGRLFELFLRDLSATRHPAMAAQRTGTGLVAARRCNTEPMKLPVMPPVAPMLAKSVPTIPPGASYEPKWDGFRSLIFRDGDEVEFGSRNEKPMTRYFPELVDAVKAELPERCVLDGEIVIATDAGLDFEALQQRIHPAVSRVTMLSEKTPASFIAFDLLALGDEDFTGRPFAVRRAALEQALAQVKPPIHLTRPPPTSTSPTGGSSSSKARISTA
jgi:ATP-dependent DNA ligase